MYQCVYDIILRVYFVQDSQVTRFHEQIVACFKLMSWGVLEFSLSLGFSIGSINTFRMCIAAESWEQRQRWGGLFLILLPVEICG